MEKLTGIILAGGGSTRMGRDKGQMPFKGKPMIQHVIDHITPLCDQILISASQARYERFGFNVIPDIHPDRGPAGGLVSVLPHAMNPAAIVIACDLPHASTALIQRLLEFGRHHQITMAETGGQLQPLCGIYRKEIAGRLMQLMTEGHYSMHYLVRQFNARILDESDLKDFDLSRELKNINQPEDL